LCSLSGQSLSAQCWPRSLDLSMRACWLGNNLTAILAMALSVHEELRKLDNLFRVKADLEQLPYYIRFHPQTTRHFRDLVEETVVSLARCADRRLPGTPQDNMIENILDLRRRWLGSGPLEFQANSRCLSQLDAIVINELKRLSECTYLSAIPV